MALYFAQFRCSRRNPTAGMIDRVGYFFDSFRYATNYWSVVMLARNFLLCLTFTMQGPFLKLTMKGAIGIVVSLVYLGLLQLLAHWLGSQQKRHTLLQTKHPSAWQRKAH